MDEILFIFTTLFIIVAVQSIILFLIIFKTPAMTFLMANLLKRPVMYIMGKDHLGVFRHFRPSSGAATIAGVGVFKLTENSHTLEYKTKTPIYLAFRDMSATLLPEFPAIIQEVREKGMVINNIDDIENTIHKIKASILKPFDVKIQSFKTYRFHDLENMFPFNLDPSFIDSTVQCEISKGLKQVKNMPVVTTTVIIMIIVAAVAIFIIRMGFSDTISASECTNMVNAAKCSISNLTGGAFR